MANQPNFYTNPAFCQQSEFYNVQRQQRGLSPQRSVRQSPVGAMTSLRVIDNSMCENDQPTRQENGYEEQEFYEEMLVDDSGLIKEKKILVVAQNNEGKKYIQLPHTDEKRQGSRCYGTHQEIARYETRNVDNVNMKNQKPRYEYIPLKEQLQDKRYAVSPKKNPYQEEHKIEVLPGKVHRYAVIQADEETQLTVKNSRYALVPVEDLTSVVAPAQQNRNRYEYIQDNSPRKLNQPSNRYEYIQTTPQKSAGRYEYTQQVEQKPIEMVHQRGNPIATQKLHELLTTPKKTPKMHYNMQTPQKMLSPQALRKVVPPPPLSPIPKTPQKLVPKAQQRLNYALGASRQNMVQDKRHTAIVAPMCSSPIQSVYSETTFSKSESWMNISVPKAPVQATLAVAAFMMLLCGGVTTGLCFYMMSVMGRLYYLDFSVVAGFACLVLGLLGFRTRNCYWLPNRNYISGYIVLSVFSLLTCAGLLILLVMQPRPGSPLADMTSGGVCGVSVLSLILATTGVVASYCCKVPPPDNRVQHCAQGFTV